MKRLLTKLKVSVLFCLIFAAIYTVYLYSGNNNTGEGVLVVFLISLLILIVAPVIILAIRNILKDGISINKYLPLRSDKILVLIVLGIIVFMIGCNMIFNGLDNLFSSSPNPNHNSFSIMWFILAALYFLPSIIGRNKRNGYSIFVVNLLSGWTLIGYVVAFAWAVAYEKPE